MKKKVALIGSLVIILPLIICLVVFPLSAETWTVTVAANNSGATEIDEHGTPTTDAVYTYISDNVIGEHDSMSYILCNGFHLCEHFETSGDHVYVEYVAYDLFGSDWTYAVNGGATGYTFFKLIYPY